MHQLAQSFTSVVEKEISHLLESVPQRGVLTWSMFIEAWFRIVRQVTFGAGARDDTELCEMVDTLRSHGNWAFLHPKDRALRERFLKRIREHLARAEPGSLAAMVAQVPGDERTAPEEQVPQWLFAFDPAGMTTFRALALLASHPDQAEQARTEIQSHNLSREPLPRLRATVLETLRLWPTTPLVLRETTRDVEWETGTMPAKTGVIIFAPFFHRDDQRIAYADRFAPEIWMPDSDSYDDAGPRDWPLVPFSGGPAICPGRHVVLLTTTAALAIFLRTRPLRLAPPDRLNPHRPLPGTLDNYSLRFEFD